MVVHGQDHVQRWGADERSRSDCLQSSAPQLCLQSPWVWSLISDAWSVTKNSHSGCDECSTIAHQPNCPVGMTCNVRPINVEIIDILKIKTNKSRRPTWWGVQLRTAAADWLAPRAHSRHVKTDNSSSSFPSREMTESNGEWLTAGITDEPHLAVLYDCEIGWRGNNFSL